MADPQPQLPPASSANLGTSIRAMLLLFSGTLAAKGADWFEAQGLINNSDSAQFIALASGMIVAIATVSWGYVQNWLSRKKLVAAAATGDPLADPKAPETKAAIATAIMDPNSAITAKP